MPSPRNDATHQVRGLAESPSAAYSLSQDQVISMQTVSLNKSHGGMQGVYKHASRETRTDMTFSVYVPPHPDGAMLPVVYYLSRLTCTHANVTDEYRSACTEL